VGLLAGGLLCLVSALAHLLLWLFTQWMVDVHCWVACEPVSQLSAADVVKVRALCLSTQLLLLSVRGRSSQAMRTIGWRLWVKPQTGRETRNCQRRVRVGGGDGAVRV
jgi:hypothetical protein